MKQYKGTDYPLVDETAPFFSDEFGRSPPEHYVSVGTVGWISISTRGIFKGGVQHLLVRTTSGF